MRRYLIWCGIVILWAAFVTLAWLLAFHTRFGVLDFGAYYEGAQRLMHGQALYQGFVGNTYIYPPLLAQLLIPLAALPRESATIVWFGLNVGLLIGMTAVLSRLNRWRGWWWVITPLFLPVLEALQVGQVTIILYALFLGTWLAIRSDRRLLGGILLGAAAWLKVYPALVIVYFLWKRDWRVVRGALISVVILALVQIAISGIDTFRDMFTVLVSLSNYGEFNLFAKNASINGFAMQVFGDHPMTQPLLSSPLLVLITRASLSLGLIAGAAVVTQGVTDEQRFDLEYGLVILTAMLLSPTLYTTGLPPLLLTYFLLLRSRPTKRMIGFVGGACVFLLLYGLFTLGYSGIPPLSGLLLSFGFYTLAATWGVNAYLLFKQTAVQTKIRLAQQIEG